MPIAFSQEPIITGTATGSTRAELIAALKSLFDQAGWAAAAVTGGWKFTLTSPQLLKCKVWLRDRGKTIYTPVAPYSLPCVSFHWTSEDETLVGSELLLAAHVDRTYEVTAGLCQAFLSLPGYSSTKPADGAWAHAVCGGVPFAPIDLLGECGEARGPHTITEAWWCSATSSLGADSFRFSWYHSGGEWSAAYNGKLLTWAAEAHRRLQLRVVTHPDWDLAGAPSRQQTQWIDGSPLYNDPLLVWGDPDNAEPGRVRGQIWDAMLGSKDAPLGDEITTTEHDDLLDLDFDVTWKNWMHYQGSMATSGLHSYYASLYLMTGSSQQGTPAAGESNYAY